MSPWHAAVLKAGTIKPRPGQSQHVEGQIKPKTALDVVAEQFEHPAGAGAEIKE